MIGRAGRPGQPQTPSRRASPAAGWIIELSSTGPGWHDSDVTRTVTEYGPGHGAGGLQRFSGKLQVSPGLRLGRRGQSRSRSLVACVSELESFGRPARPARLGEATTAGARPRPGPGPGRRLNLKPRRPPSRYPPGPGGTTRTQRHWGRTGRPGRECNWHLTRMRVTVDGPGPAGPGLAALIPAESTTGAAGGSDV